MPFSTPTLDHSQHVQQRAGETPAASELTERAGGSQSDYDHLTETTGNTYDGQQDA